MLLQFLPEMHKPLKESKEVLKSTIKVYKTIESKRKKGMY